MNNRLAVSLVFAAFGSALGCQRLTEEMPTPTQPSAVVASPTVTVPPVVVVQPIPLPSPVATPTPNPTPAPTPVPVPVPNATPTPTTSNSAIHSVRVGFFGISCPNGRTPPRNGERKLPVDCRGFVTATPKDLQGNDVPAHVHGPDIDWNLTWGQGVVRVESPTFDSNFNKDLVGLRTGEFSLCATVRSVTGCLNGQVIP